MITKVWTGKTQRGTVYVRESGSNTRTSKWANVASMAIVLVALLFALAFGAVLTAEAQGMDAPNTGDPKPVCTAEHGLWARITGACIDLDEASVRVQPAPPAQPTYPAGHFPTMTDQEKCERTFLFWGKCK